MGLPEAIKLQKDIVSLIKRLNQDMTLAEVVGVIEIVKHELIEAYTDAH